MFDDDDLDALLFGEDLVWPPELDSHGDLRTVTGLENLRGALETRAIAIKGEVPHRPEYGNRFDEFVNAPGSDHAHEVIQARQLEQFQRERRLTSVEVTVTGEDNGDVVVSIVGVARTGAVVSASASLEKSE